MLTIGTSLLKATSKPFANILFQKFSSGVKDYYSKKIHFPYVKLLFYRNIRSF